MNLGAGYRRNNRFGLQADALDDRGDKATQATDRNDRGDNSDTDATDHEQVLKARLALVLFEEG